MMINLNIDDPVAYQKLQLISKHLNQIVAIGLRKTRSSIDEASLQANREEFIRLLTDEDDGEFEVEGCEFDQDEGEFI